MKIYKFWWAWQYETIKNWLEEMEMHGQKLEKVTYIGTVFHFKDSTPQKSRYCLAYQEKLTPEYVKLATDDSWDIFSMVVGWVVLRKKYSEKGQTSIRNMIQLLYETTSFRLK